MIFYSEQHSSVRVARMVRCFMQLIGENANNVLLGTK